MEAPRRLALKGAAWAQAQVDTIRLKLFKIGAIAKIDVRRVLLQLSSTYPWKDILADAFHALRRRTPPRRDNFTSTLIHQTGLAELCAKSRSTQLTAPKNHSRRSNPENKSGPRPQNLPEALLLATSRTTHQKLRIGAYLPRFTAPRSPTLAGKTISERDQAATGNGGGAASAAPQAPNLLPRWLCVLRRTTHTAPPRQSKPPAPGMPPPAPSHPPASP